MLAIWATFIKELTELRRDRAGLLVLLVMPMTLLVVISLVQDSVMQATGAAPVRVLFVDQDHSFLGAAVTQQLQSLGGLEAVTRIHGREADEAAAREAVLRGDFQVCLVIPPGTGDALRKKIGQLTAASWALPGQAEKTGADQALTGLTLYFDPAVQGVLRTAVVNALHRVFLGIEARERAEAMTQMLPQELKKTAKHMMAQMMGSAPAPRGAGPAVPEVHFVMGSGPLLAISEQSAAAGKLMKWPTAAQQNVPGWALFGMFFIVVPIAGVLVRERQTGTFQRLMTMPVSTAALLAGKVGAYVLVCSIQFALMLAAGCYVLPWLGTAGLEPGAALLQVVPIVVAASLAATGYGLMVGTLAKTYEQASMFGPVSVVIAAALGGVMVPTYVMPHVMQKLSNLSPLAWGLTAFQEIFVRNGSLRAVMPELFCLMLFFIVTIAISGFALRGSRRQ
jgi:ABC-2 type transport system permease protein